MNQRKRLELLQKKRELEAQIDEQLEWGNRNVAELLNRDLENVNAELSLLIIAGGF